MEKKLKIFLSPIGKRFCEISERIVKIARDANEKGITEGIVYFKNDAEREEWVAASRLINREIVSYIYDYFNKFGYEEGLKRMPKEWREWWFDLKRLTDEYKAKGEI